MKLPHSLLKVIGLALVITCGIVLSSHAETTHNTSISLGTRPGFEVGGQSSGYHYSESVNHHFYSEQYGPKYGITGAATMTFNHGLFATADARFAYGQNYFDDLSGNTKSNNPDYLGEVRFLGGKDFLTDNVGLSAYTGLGYRNLYNDLSGTSDQGAAGYRRDSQYLYLPAGITPRFRITDSSRISLNLEYDYLIRGWQDSHLEDTSSLEHDITNVQNRGYGLRGSLMYEMNSWSFGPFANYWNIDQSATKFANTPACRSGCFEPHNQTIEAGLQVKYHF